MIEEVQENHPESNGKTIIEVINLSKHFKGLKAVDKVNFRIKAGELT